MVPIAGITQEKHPSFRLDSELTLSRLRQPILYPPAFKSRQLGLTCDLLGQLRCTQLAFSLLACEERQTIVSSLFQTSGTSLATDWYLVSVLFFRDLIRRPWAKLLAT